MVTNFESEWASRFGTFYSGAFTSLFALIAGGKTVVINTMIWKLDSFSRDHAWTRGQGARDHELSWPINGGCTYM